jgi:hypothetical protein
LDPPQHRSRNTPVLFAARNATGGLSKTSVASEKRPLWERPLSRFRFEQENRMDLRCPQAKKHLEGIGDIDLNQNAATPAVNQSLIAAHEHHRAALLFTTK